MITIIITNNIIMSNLYKFNNSKYRILNKSKINQAHRINILYKALTKSGFSTCFAFNESKKLLLMHNPLLELKELSKTTLEIVNPALKYYYENNIDNHSHN